MGALFYRAVDFTITNEASDFFLFIHAAIIYIFLIAFDSDYHTEDDFSLFLS